MTLRFPGGDCDASDFVAAHAGDRTPTSIGVPAVKQTRSERLLESVWEKSGSLEVNGVRVVRVPRGTIPLDEISALEGAAILGVRSKK